jgi:soluble lytic murein transglycosylase-like protein
MQLMPDTAKELGVDKPFNVEQNIEGGVKYLAELLSLFKGNTRLATAAYNAGPNAVKKYNDVPPYSETKVYVERVSILHQRYQHES